MTICEKTANEKSFYKKNAVCFKSKVVTYFGKCRNINYIVLGRFTFFSSESVSPFFKIFNSLPQWINFTLWILLFSYYTKTIEVNIAT